MNRKKYLEEKWSSWLDTQVSISLHSKVKMTSNYARDYFLAWLPERQVYIMGSYREWNDGNDQESFQVHSRIGDDFDEVHDSTDLGDDNTWRRSGELTAWIRKSLVEEEWIEGIQEFLNNVIKELE